MSSSLRDLANSVTQKKQENIYMNEPVSESMYKSFLQTKKIIDEAYTDLKKFVDADKKFNWVPTVILWLIMCLASFLLMFKLENKMYSFILTFVILIVGIIIFELIIFKPYRLKMKKIDEFEIQGMRHIVENKDKIKYLDVKYWFPLAIDYIIKTAEENKEMLYKEILEKTDLYIKENAIEVTSKNVQKADPFKYNLYEIEYNRSKTIEANNFKYNKRVLKGTENEKTLM